jgi:diguanylate cyclase (GGDEF)-like protein
VEIDDYDDLYENYGTVRAQFVVKKVAQRIFSGMRATDLLARLDRARLAVLIPGSCEMLGREIGERMRTDIESFAIDDGRGAVLQVTVSIGMVTWAPQHFPAVDMPQLARQMKATGAKALEVARTRGGNQVALSRLSTLLV